MNTELPPGIRKGESPPFYKMPYRTFEELCRDIFDTEPSVSVCEIYVKPGQLKDGIDLLSHRNDGDIEVGQCKCHKDFQPAKIREASDVFFDSWETHWRNKNVKRFILFVASDLETRKRQEEVINQKKRFLRLRKTQRFKRHLV